MFLRIVTHPRVFRDPTPLETALTFASEVSDRANCIAVSPGERHWDIFTRLCRAASARGSLIPDAYLAALAIESGAEWVTTDLASLAAPARLTRSGIAAAVSST